MKHAEEKTILKCYPEHHLEEWECLLTTFVAQACRNCQSGFGRSLSVCSESFEMHIPGRSLWHLPMRSASHALSLCFLLEIVTKLFCYNVS